MGGLPEKVNRNLSTWVIVAQFFDMFLDNTFALRQELIFL